VASSRQQREQREARDRLQRYTARQEVNAHQTKRRLRDNIFAIVGVVVVGALAAATQIFYFTAGPGAPTPAPSSSASAPPTGTNVGAPDPALAESRIWTGTLTINDIALGIELDGVNAPQATAGWVQAATTGYYPGKTCHRLATTEGFAFLQCGSLDGTGASDPSFSYGPIENAPESGVYPAGTIAMARSGDDAYSNGHQFFIVTDSTTLGTDSAGGYTVVGRVTSGLENLIDQVTSKGIDPEQMGPDGQSGAPLVPASITALTLR
jgi:peptidyl-prolyl cis-trans isomerase B (cyclophilin B)